MKNRGGFLSPAKDTGYCSRKALMNFLISVVGVVPSSAHFALKASRTSGFKSRGKRTYLLRMCFC